MFDKLANIFRIPDLRKRILFTLGMLFVYRLGGHLADSWDRYRQAGRFLYIEGRRAVRFWVLWTCSPAASCAA